MKHSLHWRNMKINIVQGSTLLRPVLVYWFKKLASHFVICILHIAIWVIQIKCRSCKRIKNLDKYACARDQIRGFFGAICPNFQIWRIICTNKKKKSAVKTFTAVLCLASHYKSKTAVLNKPILFFKSGVARVLDVNLDQWWFCTLRCCETRHELKAKTGSHKDICFKLGTRTVFLKSLLRYFPAFLKN